MVLKLAKRGSIPPFIVMDVMRNANERQALGEDILHLEVGQPSTPPPPAVLNAAQTAIKEGKTAYTEALGMVGLRQRIAQYYREDFGLDIDARRIVVTTGSSGGFVLAFLCVFDVGDRVALASPGYPAYRNILTALGVEVVEVPVGAETNFQPTPGALDAISGSLDGLILASPSNPTGTMVCAEGLKDLVAYCEGRAIRLISDEVYHHITYGEKAETVLAHTDQAVIVNSFSKYYSMTGWRIGWMVVPEDLLRSLECLSQNLFIAPPTISQYAAVAAFDCRKELDANVGRYARNRKILLKELPKAGFGDLACADGAFYLYADVSAMTNDSGKLCQKILRETGVAITPGVDFDPERGHLFVRFCFAGPEEDMAQAAERLRTWQNP
jgi:aspartate/methionine/tyrosine aminotransferase